jgi:hypothetical protein
LGLAAYGCGSSGSSSTETLNNGNNNNGGLTVSLAGSYQGTAGAFMDVNGDGWADQVVTAPAASSSPQRGAVLIYLGSSIGFSSTPIELKGAGEGDSFGSNFLPIDLDGDGKKTDFAIAALTAEGDAPLSGVVYVYKGGDTPALVATLKGEGAMDKFGWSMASGDVDGYGKPDIVVSALFNTHDQYQGGAIYVYLGNGTTVSETPAVTLYDNAGASKGLGYSVAVGDITGDGKADILAGESSKVMIWHGRATADIPAMSFSSPSVIINGVPVAVGGKGGSGFGKSVAVVGDINGDTFNDIAIGNPNRSWHNIYDNKGSVYLFKGGASLPATLYIPEKTTDGTIDSTNSSYPYLISKITGQNNQDRFGSFILPVGDAVGMGSPTPGGKPDFVVAAVWGDADSTMASMKATGKAYLFSGEHLSMMAEMPAAHAEKEYKGEATGSGFGTFVSLTKEGPDGVMLIGAPLSSEGTGAVKMIKLSDGSSVTGGATGGTSSGGGLDCH